MKLFEFNNIIKQQKATKVKKKFSTKSDNKHKEYYKRITKILQNLHFL